MRQESEQLLLGVETVKEFKPEINPGLVEARRKHVTSKLFYSLTREFIEFGIPFVDIGSSPDVDDRLKSSTVEIIRSAQEESLLSNEYFKYAGSYGTYFLRDTIVQYFNRFGDVFIDRDSEVFVTRGIIDSFGRFVRALDSTYVIIPTWSPYYVDPISTIERKQIITVPLNLQTGNLDLSQLGQKLDEVNVEPGKVLMHISHPCSPTGTVMEDNFITFDLIPFLKKRGIWLFCDSYIAATRFDGKRLYSFLHYPGVKDVAVEAITVSKELGLPDARAGGIAGNVDIIKAMRVLTSTTVDIVSLSSQRLAARALSKIDHYIVSSMITQELYSEILPRFQKMGWPIIVPTAGIDMLISVPPHFIQESIDDPSLLSSFSILRRFGVAFCPASDFGSDGKYYLRLIIKQKHGKIAEALDRMTDQGFEWATDNPSIKDFSFLKHKKDTLKITRL